MGCFACRVFKEARPQYLVRDRCGKLGNERLRRGTGALRIVRAVRILLGWEREAAVGVEGTSVGSGDSVDGGGSRREEPSGSAFGGPEALLDLGEGQRDRVEVGGIGREEEEATAHRLDGGARVGALVGTQVVQDDDLARAQGGGKDPRGVGREGSTIDRPRDRPGRTDALGGQGGQQRDIRPVIARRPPERTLAPWSPRPAARQGRVGARFIDEDEVGWVVRSGRIPPRRAGRLVSLSGDERLF